MKKGDYRKLVQAVKATPKQIAEKIAGLPPEALARRPGEGQWSIGEVILHLLDSEIVNAARLRFLLAQDRPKIMAYDQNQWAARLGYGSWNPQAALKTFKALRANTVELLKRTDPKDWERLGVHEEAGELSFVQLLERLANHSQNHLGQIDRIKASLS